MHMVVPSCDMPHAVQLDTVNYCLHGAYMLYSSAIGYLHLFRSMDHWGWPMSLRPRPISVRTTHRYSQ